MYERVQFGSAGEKKTRIHIKSPGFSVKKIPQIRVQSALVILQAKKKQI